MANKNALLGSTKIKVENMSGFDKSSFNQLSAPLGALIPIKKQLVLPGNVHCRLKIAAQIPPLATDAFLRTHLKCEAFFVPLRLCYGGFQSFFAGTDVVEYDSGGNVTRYRAKLPRLEVFLTGSAAGDSHQKSQKTFNALYGPQSLLDYLGVRKQLDSSGNVDLQYIAQEANDNHSEYYNVFPVISYQLIYDHFYRNKNVEQQLFCPPVAGSDYITHGGYIPFVAYKDKHSCKYTATTGYETAGTSGFGSSHGATANLFNGHLLQLRYRNYGDDYFTTCMPSAQEGNPISISTSGGSFTIAALRAANALQEFAEVNQYAAADYVQACAARYGVSPSDGVAQKPVCVGSVDFPMFTSGVEQSGYATSSANPFTTVGARYGRAHAEGSDFVCEFSAKEPGYFMILASVVPEANYAQGVVRDMRIFTEEGSITDLPTPKLENTGLEPVYREELDAVEQTKDTVFGYQPRYMWHKIGCMNEVHGLLRKGASLASFAAQRGIAIGPNLGHAFLAVKSTDLDNVMATSGALSQYGVIIDSKCELFVSEPLGESKLPSLVDPAAEHGHSVYLKVGGSVFNG